MLLEAQAKKLYQTLGVSEVEKKSWVEKYLSRVAHILMVVSSENAHLE